MSEPYFQTDHVQFQVLVEHLNLSSFRGFQGLEVSFEKDLTVFISNNGGGKSTILDAVWKSLESFSKYSFSYELSPLSVSGKDVTVGSNDGMINTSFRIPFQVIEILELDEEELEEGSVGDTSEISEYQAILQHETPLNVESGVGNPQIIEQPSESHAEFIRDYFISDFRSSIDCKPVFKYYRPGEIHSTNGITYFDELQDWVDRRQKIAGQKKDFIAHSHLAWLENSIKKVFSDEADEWVYQGLKIDYDLNSEDRLTISKSKKNQAPTTLAFDQMSSGERSLLGIVTNLAISLIDSNPTYLEDSTPLKEGYGVVLIDEVGVHLHPSWQRKIMPKLIELFPNIQFIVTTHSPFLLGEIPSKHIRLITNGEVQSVDETYGREVDDIVAIAMGIPAGKFSHKVSKISRSIAEGNLDQSEAMIDELIKKIDHEGENGAEHPDVLRLNGQLKRKRILGR